VVIDPQLTGLRFDQSESDAQSESLNLTSSDQHVGEETRTGSLAAWRRRVGRHLSDDGGEKLEYSVNPGVLTSHQHDTSSDPQLRRKVSRVESLRKLFLGSSHLEARNDILLSS